MQVHQLRSFVLLAQQRHFTRAAALAEVSQPSLSKQIRALENSLGTDLLIRERGNVALTTAGEALLPFAQRILIDVEGAERAVREVSRLQRGRVRLGATPSMCDALLPDVLRRFQASHPGLDLEVREGGSRVLVRELEQGSLDLALIIAARGDGDTVLTTTPIVRERLVLVGSTETDLPATLPVSALEGLPLVMFREGYDLRTATLDACRQAGFSPTLAIEGGEMSAVLRFVEAGLGYAVVPQMVLAGRPGLRAATLVEPELDRSVVLGQRVGVRLPLAAAAFRDELLAALT